MSNAWTYRPSLEEREASTRIEVGGLIFDEQCAQDAAGNLQIAPDDEPSEQTLGAKSILGCLKRPVPKAQTMLDAMFADGVAIVTSEDDRAVYQTAWEMLRDATQTEADAAAQRRMRRRILFIPAGGADGIHEISNLYRALKVRVAIIAGLDLIMDPNGLRRVLDGTCEKATADGILEQTQLVCDLIARLPPAITVERTRELLRRLAASEMDWSRDDDKTLRRDLSRLANELDRARPLKKGGVQCFKEHAEIYDGLKTIIESCKAAGLFLVPVGGFELQQADDLLALVRSLAEFHDAQKQF